MTCPRSIASVSVIKLWILHSKPSFQFLLCGSEPGNLQSTHLPSHLESHKSPQAEGTYSFLQLASLPAKCYSPRKTPPPWKEQFLPISAELCAVCLPLVGQVLLCTAQTYQLASHLLRGLCFSFKGPSAMVQQFNHRKFISLPPQS